ncbi:Pls/PosA family non-ribosomal peptide synthetase [Microvirga flavescens]|uniref:Pls/PosA family non-ribosomal peptide synthetase n=1 Tax=Microvirga flavescens TaxID=2249811 RepID=UPI000DD567B0|nr:Pls/PosA family non-ribosomal peptide synthetase [Microvirga flavescens]
MTNPLRGLACPEFIRDEVLSEIFEATVRRSPYRIAIIDGDVRLTYEGLDRAASAIARGLVAQGIGPGHVVGLWMPRGSDLLIAQLAITKTGAAWLPFDAEAPVERVAACLADAEARGLLVPDDWAERAALSGVRVFTPDAMAAAGQGGVLSPRDQGLSADRPAYMIYTSGSTGRPKGIVVTHRNICHYLRASNAVYGIHAEDVVLQACSAAFDLSMEEIWVPYLVGATLWVARQELLVDTEALAQGMHDACVTVVDTVPTLLSMIGGEVPTLRLIVLGGEACPPALAARFTGNGCRVFNSYGPTEATVVASVAELSIGDPITIGGPIPNYSCYVVDEALSLVAPGVQGELLIGGPGIAAGYLGRPDLTTEKFIANPFGSDGADPILYRSGDAVEIDAAGRIVFHGRIDDQVKIRGFRVEPGEIESILVSLPGIAQSAVVLRKDNGLDRLVAFLMAETGITPDAAQLRLALRERLPPYMVPAHFEIIPAFPRLAASGKVDRKALMALPLAFAESVLEQDEPETETEATLLAAAKRVFPDQVVPLTADFFLELGGHSLLAARFVSVVREVPLLAGITLQDVYSGRSLREIAVRLDSRVKQNENASQREFGFVPPPLARRVLCGLGQAAAMPFILTLMSAPWLSIFISYTLLTGEDASLLRDTSWVFLAYMLVTVATTFIAIASKWLIIGRIKPGRYPLWGFYYYRLWLVQRILSLVHMKWFQNSPAMRIYLRLLGAKVGAEALISEIDAGAPDLVEIGDHASIGGKVTISNARVVGNELVIGPVIIGRDVSIGSSCVVENDVTIGEGAELADLTAVKAGSTLGAWEQWRGSPAAKVGAVDPVHLPPAAEATPLRRNLLAVFYIVMLIVAPPIALIPIVPAFHVMEVIDSWIHPLVHIHYLYYMPLLALPAAALMIFATVLLIAAIRWILLPRLRPGVYSVYSGLYARKWIVGLATEVMLEVLSSLFATVYMRAWYRLMGAKIGKGSEISTNLAGRFDLIELGDQNFIADDVVLGDEEMRRGWMTLGTVKTGSRVFIGNDAVVPPGYAIATGALIGVKSKPPEGGKVGADETWFGSPPIQLPVRQRFNAAVTDTYEPSKWLKITRALFEAFNITLPTALFITFATMAMEVLTSSVLEGRWGTALGLCVLASVVISVAQLLVSVAYKWLLMGTYKPTMHPMWSWWALRTEAVSVMYWGMAGKAILDHFRGTPFLPWALRLFGTKTGQGVYMDTTDITEFDCVDIGDFAVVNANAILQTHLYEDRLMKVGRIKVGTGVTVSSGSTVLYDTNLGNFSTLGPLTLVMKGEAIPVGSEWWGSPAQTFVQEAVAPSLTPQLAG